MVRLSCRCCPSKVPPRHAMGRAGLDVIRLLLCVLVLVCAGNVRQNVAGPGEHHAGGGPGCTLPKPVVRPRLAKDGKGESSNYVSAILLWFTQPKKKGWRPNSCQHGGCRGCIRRSLPGGRSCSRFFSLLAFIVAWIVATRRAPLKDAPE